MARFISLAALVFTVAAAAQSGPTSTGFGTGDRNTDVFTSQASDRVVLFPNPANEQVSIAFPGFTGPAIVRLISGDGRVIRTEQVNQTAGQRLIAEVNELPNGYYLVDVEQDGDRVTERLVVDH